MAFSIKRWMVEPMKSMLLKCCCLMLRSYWSHSSRLPVTVFRVFSRYLRKYSERRIWRPRPSARSSLTPISQYTVCRILTKFVVWVVGRNSSVGIATRYGMDGPEIESGWVGKIFPTRPDRPWGPPSLLYNLYRVSFMGVKRAGRGGDHPAPV